LPKTIAKNCVAYEDLGMSQFDRPQWESNLQAAGWIKTDGWWSHPDAPGMHNIVSAMNVLANAGANAGAGDSS
jgi:hypothetical protein